MYKDKKILSIIPARSGSKGVIGKNYRFFFERPLVEWSIEASLNSDYIDKTIVSSNCSHVKEICDVYSNYLEEDVFMYSVRPDEISGDKSPTEEALLHTLESEEENFDYVVTLQPTSPIRNNNLIDICIQSIIDTNADSLLTVSEETPFMWSIENKKPIPHYDVIKRPRSQDIGKDGVHNFLYHENGNVYITDIETIKETKCRIGSKPTLIKTDIYQSMQIDSEQDFKTMECVAYSLGEIV